MSMLIPFYHVATFFPLSLSPLLSLSLPFSMSRPISHLAVAIFAVDAQFELVSKGIHYIDVVNMVMRYEFSGT